MGCADVRVADVALGHSGVVIEKMCEYLYYHLKHKDAKDVPDMEIPPSLCLELLVAADYFDGECGVGGLIRMFGDGVLLMRVWVLTLFV